MPVRSENLNQLQPYPFVFIMLSKVIVFRQSYVVDSYSEKTAIDIK